MYKNILRGIISTILVLSLITTYNMGEFPKGDHYEDFFKFSSELYKVCIPHNMEDLYSTNATIAEVITTEVLPCENTDDNLENLMKTIIDNSNQNGEDIRFFKDNNDKALKMKALKDAFENINASNQLSLEDICSLKNFCIVDVGEIDSMHQNLIAYDLDTNTLYIDFEGLKNIKTCNPLSLFNVSENLEDRLRLALEVGINQARISLCHCREYNTTSIREVFPHLAKNTAITEIQNRIESDEISAKMQYRNAKYEALILLLEAFNTDANIDDYYNAILSNDFPKLFSFFELQQEDVEYHIEHENIGSARGRQYKRIYHILESVDLAQNHDIDQEDYAYVVEAYKIAIDDLASRIGIFGDINLNETLYLFDFTKAIIADYVKELNFIDSEIKYSFPLELKDKLYEIEDMFYEFLSIVYRKDIDSLRERKEEYTFRALINSDKHRYINFERLNDKFPLLKTIAKDDCPSRSILEEMDAFYKNSSMEPEKRINLSQ